MGQLKIIGGSVERVRTEIAARRDGAAYDPTGDVVEFAFVRGSYSGTASEAETASWVPGSWETDGARHYACCLVGGDVQLGEGTYGVYVRVTSVPEIPVKYAGQLLVT